MVWELTDDAISSFARHLFDDTHVVLASPDLWGAIDAQLPRALQAQLPTCRKYRKRTHQL